MNGYDFRNNWINITLLFLLAFALYGSTTSFEFAYDDVLQIEHNSLVTSHAGISSIDLFRKPTPPGNLYRPITLLTYRLNHKFSELEPFSYHAINVLLYALLCPLVYIFLIPLLQDKRLALVSALIFCVHPLHVEVIANVIGRAELLSCIFGLISCLLLLKSMQSKGSQTYFLQISSVISFLIACLCKESAFTLLALIPLYYYYAARESKNFSLKSLALPVAMLTVIAAFALQMRSNALGGSLVLVSDGQTVYSENPIFHLSFIDRFIPALKVLGHYIYLHLFPFALSADYSTMPNDFFAGLYSPSGIFHIALLAGLIALIVNFRDTRWSYFGIWFLLSFSLTINIISPIGTIMGERLAFVPSLGLITFLVCFADRLISKKPKTKLGFIVFGLVFFLYAGTSLYRIPVWENNSVLFSQTLKDAPGSSKAMYNYAVLKFQNEDREEAEKYLKQALEINPKHVFSLKVMADIAMGKKEYGKLESLYKRILVLTPNDTLVAEQLDKLLKYKSGIQSEIQAKKS